MRIVITVCAVLGLAAPLAAGAQGRGGARSDERHDRGIEQCTSRHDAPGRGHGRGLGHEKARGRGHQKHGDDGLRSRSTTRRDDTRRSDARRSDDRRRRDACEYREGRRDEGRRDHDRRADRVPVYEWRRPLRAVPR
jgi:Ni/Co efflux regulator RcnB